MLRRPDRLHLERFLFAADYANAAAEAFLRINHGLVLLAAFGALHVDCVKQTPVYAHLTTATVILVNEGFVAAFLPALADWDAGHVRRDRFQAAVPTALSANLRTGHHGSICPDVDQSVLLNPVAEFKRFFNAQFLS